MREGCRLYSPRPVCSDASHANGSYPSECTRPVLHRAACSVEDAHVQHSLCRPVPSHFMLRSRTTTALGLAPTKRLPGIAGLSISLSINGHQCARACQTLCIGTDGFKSGDRLGTLDIPVCKAATKAEPYVNRACCKRCSNTCLLAQLFAADESVTTRCFQDVVRSPAADVTSNVGACVFHVSSCLTEFQVNFGKQAV